YLGAVVKKLSQASGVEVRAGSQDGAVDHIVSISAENLPLGELMDALCALHSYRSAEWQWYRSGEEGHYIYTLERPRSARDLSIRLRRMIQDEFEHDVGLLIQAALASPEQRPAIVRLFVNESCGGDQA